MPAEISHKAGTGLLRLVAAMKESHAALERFDGAAFADRVQEEVALCDKIMPKLGANVPIEEWAAFLECCRIRRAWLRGMQRTVRALWGVCAAARETYEVRTFAGH